MLRAIVATDYERGRLTRALRVMEVRVAALGHTLPHPPYLSSLLTRVRPLQDQYEVGLRTYVNGMVEEQVEKMSDMVDRRMLTMEDANEREIVDGEIVRIKMNLGRFGQQMADLLASWEKIRDKSRRMLLSFNMMRRKLAVAEALHDRKFMPPPEVGVARPLPPVQVTMNDRTNWLLRLKVRPFEGHSQHTLSSGGSTSHELLPPTQPPPPCACARLR